MHQQLWGYKVEEKLYLGVREQKGLDITVLNELSYQVVMRLYSSWATPTLPVQF
jgi:hypothetical protein